MAHKIPCLADPCNGSQEYQRTTDYDLKVITKCDTCNQHYILELFAFCTIRKWGFGRIGKFLIRWHAFWRPLWWKPVFHTSDKTQESTETRPFKDGVILEFEDGSYKHLSPRQTAILAARHYDDHAGHFSHALSVTYKDGNGAIRTVGVEEAVDYPKE